VLLPRLVLLVGARAHPPLMAAVHKPLPHTTLWAQLDGQLAFRWTGRGLPRD
jgi:hypothetical protein